MRAKATSWRVPHDSTGRANSLIGVPVCETLKKEKGLDPEDLFYLGFRCAEGTSEVRPLGEDVLAFLADKYPRAKVGKSAKNKLKLLAS